MAELASELEGLGKETFRAQQLYKWVYDKRVVNPQEMLNISKSFRMDIEEVFDFSLPNVLDHRVSVDGTQKFLFDVGDNMSVESVVIPSDGRLTLCVSSEVGCNMACRFCYTGKQKLKKRLSKGQIVGQFVAVNDVLEKDGLHLTNIVFMGMGEPLDNPEAVFGAIEILHNPHGINFSRKKITVSTSGLVPQMALVADHKVRLAVSLNGSNNEIRSQVMPINNKYPIEQLFEACMEHYRRTKDRITFEYVLLKGVTDSLEDAHRLYHLTKSIPCKINIIPFNEHPGSGYERPSDQQVKKFQKKLMNMGAHVLLRKTMGRDIYAACGQLTSLQKTPPPPIESLQTL